MSVKGTIKGFLPKNRFAHGVSLLMGGTVAGQVMLILTSPILTHLYSPEDFGLLAVYSSLLGIIAVVASLRYDLAIPLADADEDAAHVVALGLSVVIGITVLTAIIVGFYGDAIAGALRTPELAKFLPFLAVGVLLVGFMQVLQVWAIRKRTFGSIAHAKITQSFTMIVFQISGYLLGPVALIGGRVCGQAAGTSRLASSTLRVAWPLARNIRVAGMWRAARRYRRFPIFSTWSAVFNTIGQEMPSLLFASLFGVSAAGIYMLTQRVLGLPMTLIGKAVADVFFSHVAEARRAGDLATLVTNVHEKLAHIAMPLTVLLMISGPDLFARVFGDDWRLAGVFAMWMTPLLYFNFVASPLGILTAVLEKQGHTLVFQTTLLITRLIALGIGGYLGSITVAVALFALSSAFVWACWLHWLITLSGNPLSIVYKSCLQALVWSSLVALPLLGSYGICGEEGMCWIGLGMSLVLLITRYTLMYHAAQPRPAENTI